MKNFKNPIQNDSVMINPKTLVESINYYTFGACHDWSWRDAHNAHAIYYQYTSHIWAQIIYLKENQPK